MIIPWAVGIQHMAFSALVRSIPMRLCMSYPLQYMFPLTLRMCSVHFWGYPISIKYYWIYLEEYGTALLEDRYGLFLYRCGVFIYNDENSHYNVRIFVLYGCIRYFSFSLRLSLIHISEPTRRSYISFAVFCLKKFFFNDTATTEIYTRLFVGSVRCV